MVQIGEYHNHIVNLQGIIYEVNEEVRQLSSVSVKTQTHITIHPYLIFIVKRDNKITTFSTQCFL